MGNNERNHVGPRRTMTEVNIIVDNSAVCLGPATQGREKLFPRRFFNGLGGTIKEMRKGHSSLGTSEVVPPKAV